MTINGLCWDEPPADLVPLAALPGARCLVLWPTPIDADACFEEAGFREFADSTQEWDEAFERLAQLLLRAVTDAAGSPQPLPPAPVTGLARLWRRPGPRPSPLAALLAGTHDDSLRPTTVLFGSPATAALSTADGHPLWWVHSLASVPSLPDQVRAACATMFPLSRRSLPWATLSPFRRLVT